MPTRAAVQSKSSRPRVHHDHAFGMVDDPRIRGKPSSPLLVREHTEPASQSASAPIDLRTFDPNGASLDGV